MLCMCTVFLRMQACMWVNSGVGALVCVCVCAAVALVRWVSRGYGILFLFLIAAPSGASPASVNCVLEARTAPLSLWRTPASGPWPALELCVCVCACACLSVAASPPQCQSVPWRKSFLIFKKSKGLCRARLTRFTQVLLYSEYIIIQCGSCIACYNSQRKTGFDQEFLQSKIL